MYACRYRQARHRYRASDGLGAETARMELARMWRVIGSATFRPFAGMTRIRFKGCSGSSRVSSLAARRGPSARSQPDASGAPRILAMTLVRAAVEFKTLSSRWPASVLLASARRGRASPLDAALVALRRGELAARHAALVFGLGRDAGGRHERGNDGDGQCRNQQNQCLMKRLPIAGCDRHQASPIQPAERHSSKGVQGD